MYLGPSFITLDMNKCISTDWPFWRKSSGTRHVSSTLVLFANLITTKLVWKGRSNTFSGFRVCSYSTQASCYLCVWTYSHEAHFHMMAVVVDGFSVMFTSYVGCEMIYVIVRVTNKDHWVFLKRKIYSFVNDLLQYSIKWKSYDISVEMCVCVGGGGTSYLLMLKNSKLLFLYCKDQTLMDPCSLNKTGCPPNNTIGTPNTDTKHPSVHACGTSTFSVGGFVFSVPQFNVIMWNFTIVRSSWELLYHHHQHKNLFLMASVFVCQ